jgi:hypothetical protein
VLQIRIREIFSKFPDPGLRGLTNNFLGKLNFSKNFFKNQLQNNFIFCEIYGSKRVKENKYFSPSSF